MPGTGLGPVRPFGQQRVGLPCLPVPPPGHPSTHGGSGRATRPATPPATSRAQGATRRAAGGNRIDDGAYRPSAAGGAVAVEGMRSGGGRTRTRPGAESRPRRCGGGTTTAARQASATYARHRCRVKNRQAGVPGAGLEPARPLGQQLGELPCLPVPPPGHPSPHSGSGTATRPATLPATSRAQGATLVGSPRNRKHHRPYRFGAGPSGPASLLSCAGSRPPSALPHHQ